jgi:type I restriction enzyme S subunit
MNRVNVPQLRFKGFEGEWKNKTLFDISKEVSYGMNAAAKAFDGTHKYIRITDIDIDSRKFIPNPLTSPEGHIDEKFKLKDNDLLFTRTGASVGKSYLYDSKDGALYYAGFLIKFNIAKANSYFVYSLTLKESYDKWVQVNSMRSGQPGLNAEEYKAFEICLPLKKNFF